MTLKEFKSIDETEQLAIIWKNGVHVATRDDELYQYLLYQIDSFYVEVWYHIELEMIHHLRSFSNMNLIEPYLENIDIHLLYQ